jgi:PhoD-like phosphatase
MLGARQKAWLKDGLRASRAPFKFVLSTVPLHGPWGPDRWAGYPHERDELLAFVRSERIGGVIVLSADVHAAVDVDFGDGVREFIAGPLAAWTLCSLVPMARRYLQASGRPFVCDSFNWARLTVRRRRARPRWKCGSSTGRTPCATRATCAWPRADRNAAPADVDRAADRRRRPARRRPHAGGLRPLPAMTDYAGLEPTTSA